jgi:hypothetical protein
MKGIGYGEDFFMIKKDEELIKEHITRLILTNNGERVGNYSFGSNIKDYLFSFSLLVKQDMETSFIDLLKVKMPEITIRNFSVSLNQDIHTMYVSFDILKNETLEKFYYEQGFILDE